MYLTERTALQKSAEVCRLKLKSQKERDVFLTSQSVMSKLAALFSSYSWTRVPLHARISVLFVRVKKAQQLMGKSPYTMQGVDSIGL